MRKHAPLHRLWTLSLALLFLAFQFANKDLDRAFKALQGQDFTTAERLFNKILLDDADDARAFFGLAAVYAHPDFPHRNAHRALEYLSAAEERFPMLRKKEVAFLEKYGVTPGYASNLRVHLGTEIVQEAYNNRSISALEAALRRFESLPEVARLARARRDELAFAEAEKVGTYQAYQSFMIKYPEAGQVAEARKRYESLLYQSFARIGTLLAYEQFMQAYPQSPYYNQAREAYNRLIYEEVARKDTPEAYRNFVSDYPDSPYVREARARLQLYDLRLPVRLADAWGFINGRGELVIPPAFERAGPFAGGLARVRQNGKWGYIDDQGKMMIAAKFDIAQDFSEGLAVVLIRSPKRGKKPLYQAFYIDTTGRQAFDKSYETDGLRMPIHPFSDGLGAVIEPRTLKLGFVDRQGNFAVAPLFAPTLGLPSLPPEYAFSGFRNGFAWVKDEAGEGLIDRKGVFLVHGKYTQPRGDTLPGSRYRESFSNGLCPVQEQTNGKMFYVDSVGRKTIPLPAGVVGLSFRDSVAWVKLPVAGQYQLIDKTGAVLTDVYATRVRPFAEGLAVVQREAPAKRVFFYDEVPEGSYVYLDKKGNQPFDFKFHVLTEPEYSFLNGDFNGGIAGVLLEGRQTYIDREGNVVWQSNETW
jgi:hypothetical protein